MQILLRKGGIRESSFKLPAKRFLLLPNAFHCQENLLKQEMRDKYAKVRFCSCESRRLKKLSDMLCNNRDTPHIQELLRDPKKDEELLLEFAAEITGTWMTTDQERVNALGDLHIWSRAYVDNRFAWRQRTPVTVLELRCSRLKEPFRLRNTAQLWGCFSFADIGVLSEEVWQTAIPVLDSDSFQRKQRQLRCILSD